MSAFGTCSSSILRISGICGSYQISKNSFKGPHNLPFRSIPLKSTTKPALQSSGIRNENKCGPAPRSKIEPTEQDFYYESLSPTSRLPGQEEEGASDIQRPASKASDRKQSLTDLPQESLKGRTVFVRCDFNVPLDENGSIVDDTRIRASLPTIKYLVDVGARLVLASHLGRPEGVFQKKYSLKPVAERLNELLDLDVRMAPDCIGPAVEDQISALHNGQVLLLENVRFHAEEEANDVEFSKQMAKNIDIFVNDAFATAHREHASTEGIGNYVSSRVAGLLMEKELKYLTNTIQRPQQPFVVIIGGSKVSSKIGVMKSLLNTCEKVIVGGGMSLTFIKAQGGNVGSSVVENEKMNLTREILRLAEAKGVEIILPLDIVCADSFSPAANTQICEAAKIPNGWMGLDVGPKSLEKFQHSLQGSKTILWTGPMGLYEFDKFAKGTIDIARMLVNTKRQNKSCITIIGGGDTIAIMEKTRIVGEGLISHISTGGGATLELLEGKVLPGVAILDDIQIRA